VRFVPQRTLWQHLPQGEVGSQGALAEEAYHSARPPVRFVPRRTLWKPAAGRSRLTGCADGGSASFRPASGALSSSAHPMETCRRAKSAH